MRRAARIDANQPAIVDALRKVGCKVTPLHMVGQGCPDLLVWGPGRWILMEVKDGTKVPSKRELTADEQAFFDLRADAIKAGALVIVESVGDALEAVEAI